MKKLLLSTICATTIIFGFNNVAYSQENNMPPPPHHEMMKKGKEMHKNLAKKLNLSEEQIQKADKIREEGRKKMKPLIEEKKAIHEKMNKLRKENM